MATADDRQHWRSPTRSPASSANCLFKERESLWRKHEPSVQAPLHHYLNLHRTIFPFLNICTLHIWCGYYRNWLTHVGKLDIIYHSWCGCYASIKHPLAYLQVLVILCCCASDIHIEYCFPQWPRVDSLNVLRPLIIPMIIRTEL